MHMKVRLSLISDTHFLLHCYYPDGRWVSNRDMQFVSRIPERKQDQSSFGTWKVAATDVTLEILDMAGVELEILDDETQAKVDYIRLRIELSNITQMNNARYKEERVVPKHGLKVHSENALAAYQEVGLVNAHLSEGFGLFMEQGTGKTAVTIAAACNLPKGDVPLRVLIITPNNVRTNWKSELEKFSTVNHKAMILRGSQVKRIDQLISAIRDDGQDITFVISSYDTMIQTWDAISMMRWDMAILDESQYIKSSKTRRWKYCSKLRDISDKRIVLTGTPIANSLMDLYTQFEFMGEGYSGFSTFEGFKKFFGTYAKQGEQGYERLVAAQNIPVLKDRLSRYTFMIKKFEALPDLPDKVYDIEEVEMSPEQSDAYTQLATSLAIEIENELDTAENPSLVVNNILTKLLKLAQITSGFLSIPEVYDEAGELVKPKEIIHFSPNPKIEALLNLVNDKPMDDKTIIWACWVEDIKKIERALRMAGHDPVTYYGGISAKEQEEAVRRFNEDPSCRFIIGNPAAGGTGINLLGYPPGRQDEFTTNCNHEIYFSQRWSSLERSQSEDRAHRRGTRGNVRITDLCVPETIDETIRARVLDKRRAALELTDIRSILKEILR